MPAPENPCKSHWQNMSEDTTAKLWGIFEEMGIFVAICRHGCILKAADMVQSGELYVAYFPVKCI